MTYGLIGKFEATEGDRDKLIQILRVGTKNMPGCVSYVIAKDLIDQNTIWITEVWETQENHAASLQLPEVQAAIAEGRQYISGMTPIAKTHPIL